MSGLIARRNPCPTREIALYATKPKDVERIWRNRNLTSIAVRGADSECINCLGGRNNAPLGPVGNEAPQGECGTVLGS